MGLKEFILNSRGSLENNTEDNHLYLRGDLMLLCCCEFVDRSDGGRAAETAYMHACSRNVEIWF